MNERKGPKIRIGQGGPVLVLLGFWFCIIVALFAPQLCGSLVSVSVAGGAGGLAGSTVGPVR